MIHKPAVTRLASAVMTISLVGVLPVLFAQSALAASLCVGSQPGCFATLQAAVGAARNGDTITIAPGTYAGGVTIDVSVTIIGAGAGVTIISGGGPVLTIGNFGSVSEPSVTIEGVTITGGVTETGRSGQIRVVPNGGRGFRKTMPPRSCPRYVEGCETANFPARKESRKTTAHRDAQNTQSVR